MPGVQVQTATTTGASTSTVPESGRAFMPGRCQRGSTTAPIRVVSLTDFEAKCGPRQAYGSLYDAVRDGFDQGLGEVFVARVVGPAAVAATINLVDRAGTPLPTISVTANSKGAWANGWTVTIAAGTISGTVTLTLKDSSGVVRETHANKATVADLVASPSGFVVFANLNSATAAPNNLPAVATSTLASGNDDGGAITPAHYVTALDLFGDELGSGIVSIPGFAAATVAGSSTIGAGVAAHASLYGRMYSLFGSAGESYSQALAAQAAFRAVGAENGVYLWPYLISRDGVASRTLSPDAFAAGCRANAHAFYPNYSPARVTVGRSRAKPQLVPEFTVTDTIAQQLHDAGISVIRNIGGFTQLYGWRSLSTDDRFWDAGVADLRNTLARDLREVLAPFINADVDYGGRFAADVKAKLEGRLAVIARRGGLYASPDDPGYAVDVTSLNTPESLSQRVFQVVVYFRPSPKAELIKITLVYAGLTASITTI